MTPEQVLITTGSQQALDLAARALLDPGDRVVIESPSYLAAIQLFDSAEVEYQTVAVDEEGMVVDGVAAALNGAKLVYTLPNFQNPTGLTLSANRRVELARRAVEAGAALLEDDAYHDLRYDGEHLPSVSSLEPNPWAIYTGSFSKVIAPGIRVGYLCGSPEVIERLTCLKQITDLHTGSLTQRIAFEYCVRGFLEPGIQRLRGVYRSRRDVMLAALRRALRRRREMASSAGRHVHLLHASGGAGCRAICCGSHWRAAWSSSRAPGSTRAAAARTPSV